jgi:hypothetical protein
MAGPINKAPAIKKSKTTRVAEFMAKNNKMIRGQFLTYGLKGKKEMQLTYKIDEGNVYKKYVKHGDILELPYGYIKYLNEHGSIKKVKNTRLKLQDEDGNNRAVTVDDNEPRYFFRVLDILSSEEMAELDPSTVVGANFL